MRRQPPSCARRSRTGVAGALLAGALVASSPTAAADGELQALRLRGLTARPAALLMSGQSGGAVPLAVLALPVPCAASGDAAAACVVVVVEADARTLAGQAEGEARSEIYVYATDATGAPRSFLTQTFTMPTALAVAEEAQGVRFLGHLELPPGEYDLRVLVLGAEPDRFGLYRVPLPVPDFSSAAPVVLPPLVGPASSDGWLLVREAPHGAHRQDPTALLGLESWPAARPVLKPGWKGEILLLGRGWEDLPADLSSRLVGSGERQLGRITLGSPPEAAPAPPGLTGRRLQGRLEASGSGVVRWTLESAAEGLVLPPPREVFLAAEGAGPWPWADRTAEAAPEVAAAEAPVPEKEARRGEKKVGKRQLTKVERRYPEVLLEAAAGDRSEAVTELASLEAGIVEGRSLGAVGELREVQMAVLRDLAGQQPESLVPAIWLHLDLFERYVRERRLLLAVHARVLIRAMADLYLNKGVGEESKLLAADLLTAFGGVLREVSLRKESEAAFREALSLDPDQVEARKGLAMSYERSGRDADATDQLAAWAARRPKDAEACARLGRVQLRSGNQKQAEAILRHCLTLDEPAWAVAVALEELALLVGRQQGWKEVSELLAKGSRRLPDEPRLRLLHAYALDRLQQPSEGLRALSSVDPAGRLAGESARARYSRWPEEIFGDLRRSLEPAIESRRPALAGVLRREGS